MHFANAAWQGLSYYASGVRPIVCRIRSNLSCRTARGGLIPGRVSPRKRSQSHIGREPSGACHDWRFSVAYWPGWGRPVPTPTSSSVGARAKHPRALPLAGRLRLSPGLWSHIATTPETPDSSGPPASLVLPTTPRISQCPPACGPLQAWTVRLEGPTADRRSWKTRSACTLASFCVATRAGRRWPN